MDSLLFYIVVKETVLRDQIKLTWKVISLREIINMSFPKL